MNEPNANGKSNGLNHNGAELVIIKKPNYRFGKKKRMMLEALKNNLGIVTASSKQVGIDRQTHYNWMKDDAQYREAVEDISSVALDYVEGKLLQKIKDGDTIALLFYLKCKGKERGYVEKKEIEMPSVINVDFTEHHATNTEH